MRLSVPLPAKPKARPRFSRGHAYHAKPYRDWLNAFRLHAMDAVLGGPALATTLPLTGPVRVNIEFHSPKKFRCDVDNALGACLDGMNTLVYEDDRQVTDIRGRWVPNPHETRIDIEVEEIDA